MYQEIILTSVVNGRALQPTPNGTVLPGGDPISQWAAPETHAVQRTCEREKLSGELLASTGSREGPLGSNPR